VREGCPHCAKAEQSFWRTLARERPDLDITVRDVLHEPAALQRLQEITRQHGGGNARVPAFFVGGQIIFGYSEEASTDKLIRQALQGQRVRRLRAPPKAKPVPRWTAPPAGPKSPRGRSLRAHAAGQDDHAGRRGPARLHAWPWACWMA
jgi:glutaredoxin